MFVLCGQASDLSLLSKKIRITCILFVCTYKSQHLLTFITFEKIIFRYFSIYWQGLYLKPSKKNVNHTCIITGVFVSKCKSIPDYIGLVSFIVSLLFAVGPCPPVS